jgi:hypothetical protein
MFNIYISSSSQYFLKNAPFGHHGTLILMVFPLCEPQIRNFCSQMKWANQLIGVIVGCSSPYNDESMYHKHENYEGKRIFKIHDD